MLRELMPQMLATATTRLALSQRMGQMDDLRGNLPVQVWVAYRLRLLGRQVHPDSWFIIFVQCEDRRFVLKTFRTTLLSQNCSVTCA